MTRPPMAGWPTLGGCADCNDASRICYHDRPAQHVRDLISSEVEAAEHGDFRPSDAKYDE